MMGVLIGRLVQGDEAKTIRANRRVSPQDIEVLILLAVDMIFNPSTGLQGRGTRPTQSEARCMDVRPVGSGS